MSAVAELLPPTAAPPVFEVANTVVEPNWLRHWSVEEYERLGELGFLTEEDRVELLDGLIVNKEVNHPPHSDAVDELTEFFTLVGAGRWRVRCQHAIRLPRQNSMPEPDLALVRRRPEGYRQQHPGPDDIFLLVEVSNTSVATDRGRKLAIYARAGVLEYWIVNVPEHTVEVYRDPQPDTGTYADAEIVRPGATLAPAAFPDAGLSVADLFGAEPGPDAGAEN